MKKLITIFIVFLISFSASISAQDFIRHSFSEKYGIDQQLVGDYDNDGDLDIFGIYYRYNDENRIVYMKNESSGGILNMEGNILIDRIEAFGKPVEGDFDLDGDLDVIVAIGFENPELNIFLNDGVGNFTQSPLNINNVKYLLQLDYDLDGDLDIIGKKDSIFSIFSNGGNANFNLEKTFEVEGEIEQFVAADIDEDGDIDIVMDEYKFYDNKILLFKNNGDLNFTKSIIFNDKKDIQFIRLFDFNQDGKKDIVFVDDDYCISLLNQGNLSFAEKTIMEKFDWSGTLPGFDLADIDKDGDIDLMVSEYSHGLFYFENKGGNSLDEFEGVKISEIQPIYDVIINDYTGDGKDDILVCNGSLWIIENDLKLNTSEEYISDVNFYPNPVIDNLSINLEGNSINKISIFDLSGKLLNSYGINNNSKNLDLSHLNSGLYIIKIYNQDFVYSEKLVKY